MFPDLTYLLPTYVRMGTSLPPLSSLPCLTLYPFLPASTLSALPCLNKALLLAPSLQFLERRIPQVICLGLGLRETTRMTPIRTGDAAWTCHRILYSSFSGHLERVRLSILYPIVDPKVISPTCSCQLKIPGKHWA
nr:hypothetical protein Q903MT_gene6362 [Picea sitchensis]